MEAASGSQNPTPPPINRAHTEAQREQGTCVGSQHIRNRGMAGTEHQKYKQSNQEGKPETQGNFLAHLNPT